MDLNLEKSQGYDIQSTGLINKKEKVVLVK